MEMQRFFHCVKRQGSPYFDGQKCQQFEGREGLLKKTTKARSAAFFCQNPYKV